MAAVVSENDARKPVRARAKEGFFDRITRRSVAQEPIRADEGADDPEQNRKDQARHSRSP
jgi:hypothetical protein